MKLKSTTFGGIVSILLISSGQALVQQGYPSSGPLKCRPRTVSNSLANADSYIVPGGSYLPAVMVTSTTSSIAKPTQVPSHPTPSQNFVKPSSRTISQRKALTQSASPVGGKTLNKPTTSTIKPVVVPNSSPKPNYKSYGEVNINCFLSMHNHARAQVGLGPLTWSFSLQASATAYSNVLYARNPNYIYLVHSYLPNVGENLYASSAKATCQSGVQAWLDEKPYYRPGSPVGSGNFESYGHYSQIVDRDVKHVGCGFDTVAGKYLTCHYDKIQISGYAAY